MKKFIAFLLMLGFFASPTVLAATNSGKDSIKKIVIKPTNPKPRDTIIKFPLLHTGNPIQILIHTTEGNEYEGWIEW